MSKIPPLPIPPNNVIYRRPKKFGFKTKMDVNRAKNLLENHGYTIIDEKGYIGHDGIPGVRFELVEDTEPDNEYGVSKEVIKKVYKRTTDHVARVKYFYNKLIERGYIPKELQNKSEVDFHDEDKFEDKNLVRQSIRYCYTPDQLTPELEQAIQDVVHEHVKSNPHHCEYWGDGDQRTTGMDCSKMPAKYVYEMMADWASTAEERGGKVIDWANSSVINFGGKRWSFSDEAIDIMEETIPFLDSILDKSLKRDYGLTFIDPAFLKKKREG